MAAAAAATDPGAAVALFTTTTPALVVIARAADGGIDAGAVLKALVAQFGGKGGGKPDLAQGGGLTGDVREIVAAARAAGSYAAQLEARSEPSRQPRVRVVSATSAPSAARRRGGSPRRSASRSR